MKKRYALCALLLLPLAAGSFGLSRIGKGNAVSLPAGSTILQTQAADFDGDGQLETVYLYGSPQKDGSVRHVNVAVMQPNTGFTQKTNLTSLSGTHPSLYLADFNGDGRQDVFLCVRDAKNTVLAAALDFSSAIPFSLLSPKDACGLTPHIALQDGFFCTVSFDAQKSFSFLIEENIDRLIAQGIYDQNGNLLITDPEVVAQPYSTLVPVAQDGGFVLHGKQPLLLKQSDTEIASLSSTLCYVGNRWILQTVTCEGASAAFSAQT